MPAKKKRKDRGQSLKLHGITWADRLDATDTIKIGPLKKSDFNAEAKNTMQCVLAKAVNRQKKMINGRAVSAVWIGANVVDVCFKDEPNVLYRYFLSQDDMKRVHTFDEHPDMVKQIGTWSKNITVTLVPPPPAKKLGYQTHSKNNTRGKGTQPRKEPLRHLFAENGDT